MEIMWSVFSGVLVNVSTELAKSLIEIYKEKKDNDRKAVERIKSAVGELCDAYDENIEEPIENDGELSKDEVVEFFCEQNEALGELLETLYEYREAVSRVLPKKAERYLELVDQLRKIRDNVEAFEKGNAELDTEKALNEYQNGLTDLYRVFD